MSNGENEFMKRDIGYLDNNEGQKDAYQRATSLVEDGGDIICHRPDISACLECGENTPENGTMCEECRLDALGD